eukprot:scaffold100228_cov19-Tisochrysis_lutea.AAC.1
MQPDPTQATAPCPSSLINTRNSNAFISDFWGVALRPQNATQGGTSCTSSSKRHQQRKAASALSHMLPVWSKRSRQMLVQFAMTWDWGLLGFCGGTSGAEGPAAYADTALPSHL